VKLGQIRKEGLLFVVSGPSGSGKTTLLKRLLLDRLLKKRLARSVSLTTRPKRPGEKDKKDYFFISPKQFLALRRKKKILEWTRYLGYYYATPKDVIELNFKRGHNILLCLDLKGARRIKRIYPANALTFFIVPPSFKALKGRIIKRSRNPDQKEVRERLKLAREELLAKKGYDHCLVNKNLNVAVARLKQIIIKELKERQH
jgi:guanylate kinase